VLVVQGAAEMLALARDKMELMEHQTLAAEVVGAADLLHQVAVVQVDQV